MRIVKLWSQSTKVFIDVILLFKSGHKERGGEALPKFMCTLFIEGTNGSVGTKGIVISRIPTGTDEWSNNWRENIINIVKWDSVNPERQNKQIEHLHLWKTLLRR